MPDDYRTLYRPHGGWGADAVNEETPATRAAFSIVAIMLSLTLSVILIPFYVIRGTGKIYKRITDR